MYRSGALRQVSKSLLPRSTHNSPNIRLNRAVQTVEQIPEVIVRLNPLLIRAAPLLQHVLHDRVPRDEDVLNARQKPFLIRIQQVEHLRLVRGRAVEVRGCAHDRHAAVVDFAREVAAQEDFEVCVVWLI